MVIKTFCTARDETCNTSKPQCHVTVVSCPPKTSCDSGRLGHAGFLLQQVFSKYLGVTENIIIRETSKATSITRKRKSRLTSRKWSPEKNIYILFLAACVSHDLIVLDLIDQNSMLISRSFCYDDHRNESIPWEIKFNSKQLYSRSFLFLDPCKVQTLYRAHWSSFSLGVMWQTGQRKRRPRTCIIATFGCLLPVK